MFLNICCKAVQQLHVLTNQEARMESYSKFSLSNFNNFPVVWHVCGIQCSQKIEQFKSIKICLCRLCNNIQSTHCKRESEYFDFYRVRFIARVFYKIFTEWSLKYLQDVTEQSDYGYNLHSLSPLTQPKCNQNLHS